MADKALYSLLIDLRANVAQLSGDLDKASGALKGFGGRTNQIMQGIAQGIGQAFGKAAVDGVVQMSKALATLADRGEEVGSVVENFKKLGGSADAIDKAKRAVLGTVSAFDLMKVANEGIVRGIPNLNKNFEKLSEFAGRFADATGRDTLQVLQQLTDAIGKGSNKALLEFGIQVDQSADRATRMQQALVQVSATMGNFAELTDSVSNAHKGFANAMDDAWAKVGIGINENEELTKVYRQLEEAIHSIDWVEIGQNIASMAASIAGVLPTLKGAADFVNTMALGLETYLNKTDRAKMVNLQIKERELQDQIAGYDAEAAKKGQSGESIFGSLMDANATMNLEAARRAREELAALQKELVPLQKAYMDAINGKPAPGGGGGKPPPLFGGGSGGDSPAAKEIEKLKEKWGELTAKIRTDGLKDAIEDSVKAVDVTRFEELKKQLAAQVSQAFIEGNKEFLKAGVTVDQLTEQAEIVAAAQVAEYQEKMDEALRRERADRVKMMRDVVADEALQRKKLYAAYGLDFSAENGGFGGLLQQAASMFGGDSALASTFGQFSSQLDGLGRYLYDSATFLGNTMSAQQAYAAGIQGPAMANGQFGAGGADMAGYLGWAQAGMSVLGSFLSADDRDRDQTDNRAYGESVGAAAGAALLGAFSGGALAPLGAAIGGAFGKEVGKLFGRGSQDADTQARHSFANWWEDQLKEVGGLAVFNADSGTSRRMTNFIEGSRDRFNAPGWGDAMRHSPNGGAFSGAGMGLAAHLGVDTKLGDQLGAMLFDNMEGDVNNLRVAMQKFGVTAEDMEQALVELGKTGEKTWLEVETAMQGSSQAFGRGLVEVGDVNLAMERLLATGGRGMEALIELRNVAVEADEANIKNFELLRKKMLEAFDPATVDAFFRGLQQRGIDTIAELGSADDRTLGGVVADMDAAGAQFKEVGAQIGDSMKEAQGSINSAISAIQENTAAVRGIQYEAPEDDLAVDSENARGGIIMGPQRALMGEAGPEAILPLTRRNGKLGVAFHGVAASGGGTVIHVDARGAAHGVEHKIRAAVRAAEERISRNVQRAGQYARGRTA